MRNKAGYFWTSWYIAVIRHAVSAYSFSCNVKWWKHYIQFTCDFNNICHRQNQQWVCMFRKQLRQCNFILKCKSNNSLVSKAKVTNANKSLLRKGFAHFWHWLNCFEILISFSFASFPLILIFSIQ